jgi:HPr kinase/phosphorylase
VRAARSGADLVGYLNYIHPYRVQILGRREIAYLTNATPEDCARRISRIVTLEPPVLVLADGQVAPSALVSHVRTGPDSHVFNAGFVGIGD